MSLRQQQEREDNKQQVVRMRTRMRSTTIIIIRSIPKRVMMFTVPFLMLLLWDLVMVQLNVTMISSHHNNQSDADRLAHDVSYDTTTTTTRNLTTSVESIKIKSSNVRRNKNVTRTETSPSSKKAKPSLIFHVGPPKTATTSIQMDLLRYRNILERDDRIYCGGKFILPPELHVRGPAVFYHTKHTDLYNAADNMFKTRYCGNEYRPSCMVEFKRILDQYKDKNTGVLLSDESYANMWLHPTAYTTLRDELSPEWDILLVIGYRHFYDWVISRIFQSHRLDHYRKKYFQWPKTTTTGDDTVGVDGGGGGEGQALDRITNLFLTDWRRWDSHSKWFTSDIIRLNDDVLSYRILDISSGTRRENTSLHTEFFCNVLPNAPNTCRASQEQDVKMLLSPTAAATTTDAVLNGQSKSDITHFYYDHIATKAAEWDMINFAVKDDLSHHTDDNSVKALKRLRYSRRYVRESIRYYNEQVLNRTHMDFDMICPNDTDLHEFLQISLNKQRSSFHHHIINEGQQIRHTGNGTAIARRSETTTQVMSTMPSPGSQQLQEHADEDDMEREHIESFMERVHSKVFCWIDTEKVLSSDVWKEFFAKHIHDIEIPSWKSNNNHQSKKAKRRKF